MHCKTVVIVEDERDIRATLQELLEMEGYEVYGVSNGKEGLELLHRIERPCLILLDLMMPVMTGWEFMQARSEDSVIASIPVVIVSAVADEVKGIGASGYIKKPIELDTILRIAKRYCKPVADRKESA